MQTPEFTDEELMAYADGELDEARAMTLDQALAEDAGLADRLALFVDTRASGAARARFGGGRAFQGRQQ